MGLLNSCKPFYKPLIYLIISTSCVWTAIDDAPAAVTASHGQPYKGQLVNGVPFPSQFPGYTLREAERTYTTPEVVGAMLDAIDAVREQFPETCDLYLGDFSRPGGGSMNNHRSHENGRDVDIGMYAKGNRYLNRFMPMNEQNLDVAKTWCLVQNLIRSQRVQYIFLDRSVQKLLYDYALSTGTDPAYADRIFGNGRDSIVRHLRNHVDHIHARFFTPWSTLAAHVGSSERQKLAIIDMAQQSYLPTKVNYYVKGSERSPEALAQSLGVSAKELCEWNRIDANTSLAPGSCLVYYKRGFEVEPVHLAQSLQPGFILEPPAIKLAALPPSGRIMSDASASIRSSRASREPSEKKTESTRSTVSSADRPGQAGYTVYTVKPGETLQKIAIQNGMKLKALQQLNGLKPGATVRPGQSLLLVGKASSPKFDPSGLMGRTTNKPAQEAQTSQNVHTVIKGDTLAKIAARRGIDLQVLCSLNGLKKNTSLKPGQKLILSKVEAPAKQKDSPAQRKTSDQFSGTGARVSVSKTLTAVQSPPPQKASVPRPAVLKTLSKNNSAPKLSSSAPTVPAKPAPQAKAGKARSGKTASAPAKTGAANTATAKTGKEAEKKSAGIAKKPAGAAKAVLKTASVSSTKKR